MLLSRGTPVFKILKTLKNIQSKPIIRNSHAFNYRVGPPPPAKGIVLTAEIVQGFAWWWVLWHLWTEPGHILGEFEYPDASKWTDEELGITDV